MRHKRYIAVCTGCVLIALLGTAMILTGCNSTDMEWDYTGTFGQGAEDPTTAPTEGTSAPTDPSTPTEPSQPDDGGTEPTQPSNPGGNTQQPEPEPEPDPEPTSQMGTINVYESLNVRSSPSTDAEIVGTLKSGDRVEVLEQKAVGTMVWGRIEQGWISMEYVELDIDKVEPQPKPDPKPDPEPDPEPDPMPMPQMGTVKVNDSLNVRSNPSTDAEVVGALKNGDRVEILELKTVDTMTWGRITEGWISMNYVELDMDKPEPEPDTDGLMTWEEYQALSGDEQYAYSLTFPKNGITFNEWYLDAYEKWDAAQDKGYIGPDGEIELN